MRKYTSLKDAPERMAVVIKEIESWYLAGLGDKAGERMGVTSFQTTDNVTKERFDSIMPSRFDSRIDFMCEMLKNFDFETAVQKNRSFAYFAAKFLE